MTPRALLGIFQTLKEDAILLRLLNQTQGNITNAPSEWLRGPNRNKVLSEQIRADPDPPSESIAAEVPATVPDSTQGSQTEANQGDTNGIQRPRQRWWNPRSSSRTLATPRTEARRGFIGGTASPNGRSETNLPARLPWLESSGLPRIRRLWLQNLCHGHLQLSGKGTK